MQILRENWTFGLSLLILSLPVLGLGSKSTSLSLGFCVCRPRQYDTISWELHLFPDFLFLLRWLFGQMDSMDVAGVLQEAGDTDSRAHTRSEVWVEYNIIPWTSTSIPLPYFCQGYNVTVFLLQVMGGMGRLGVVYLCYGLGGGTGGGYHSFSIFCSVLMLLLIVLSWLVHDSLCLFPCSFFAFFVSGPFN